MKLKPGVSVMGIKPEMLVGLMVAKSVYDEIGAELIVTSVCDGVHSKKSLHYMGCAVDLRIRHITAAQAETVVHMLEKALPNDFFVLLESTHIHLSWRPTRR